MAGGKGNIRPEDGKQFSTEYQPDKEIWKENIAINLLTDLINWLNEKDEDGEDKGNIFFDEFIYLVAEPKKYHPKAVIYADLIGYLSHKFTSCLDLIEKARKIQEIKLVKYGCADRLNSTMTKFVLTNKHGYRDKQELTGKDGEPIQIISDPFAKMRENNGINDKTKDSV